MTIPRASRAVILAALAFGGAAAASVAHADPMDPVSMAPQYGAPSWYPDPPAPPPPVTDAGSPERPDAPPPEPPRRPLRRELPSAWRPPLP